MHYNMSRKLWSHPMQIRRAVSIVLVAAVLAVAAGCSRENQDWRSAQAADTVEGYDDFVAKHPQSEFAEQAKSRVKQLAEERDWERATVADTAEAYQQFVAQHADGKWAQEARVRIENFKIAVAGGGAVPVPVPGEPAAPAPAAGAAATKPASAVPKAAAPAPTPAPVAKPAPKPAPKPASKPASSAPTGGAVRVQLGAFGSTASAREAWAKVKTQWPKQTRGLSPQYEPVKSGGKTLYRLRVSLPNRSQAEQFCGALKQQKHACLIAG
jgi:cell division septation protein DedD